jgi:integrase
MDGEDTLVTRPTLLEQVRARMRVLHYSYRTEAQYVQWIRRFILFHDKRHPARMAAPEVESFLTHLAVQDRVAAPTQNQAKAAILFLYKQVLGQELDWLDGVTTAKASAHLPVVLTMEEVRAVLGRLTGVNWLIASLLYGSGLRLMEAIRLRVKDVEFTRREVLVRDGKGGKDRVTMLSDRLIEPLRDHCAREARARAGSRGRVWRGVSALRSRAQVSARRPAVGLAIRLSRAASVARSPLGPRAAASHRREGRAARDEGGGPPGGRG